MSRAITNLARTGFLVGATLRFGVICPGIPRKNLVNVSPTRITCPVALPSDAEGQAHTVIVGDADGENAPGWRDHPPEGVDGMTPGGDEFTFAITNPGGTCIYIGCF